MLGKLARQHDPNVLVGFDTADDAGVYQLTPELALVQTVDFFTPIVDDPYVFGQIAATNSLSDVYAMGGRPISALAMVCFPENGDPKVLEEMLAGGLSKMVEANCTIIGGHSIRDEEIKLGYSVTGTIHPQKDSGQQWGAGRRPPHLHQGHRHGRDLDCHQAWHRRFRLDSRRGPFHDHAEQSCGRGRNLRRLRGAWHDRRHRLRPDRPRARDGARLRRQLAASRFAGAACCRARWNAFAEDLFPEA